MRNIRTIQDVVDWGLCVGCGACHYACDSGKVSLKNIDAVGIRPSLKEDCLECTECLEFCPGASVKSTHSTPRSVARGMLRVDTERRFLFLFKNRGLAPSNVSNNLTDQESGDVESHLVIASARSLAP